MLSKLEMNLVKGFIKSAQLFESFLLKSVQRNAATAQLITQPNRCMIHSYSIFGQANEANKSILSVSSPSLVQYREYKPKVRLRKRCRNCYFVWRNGRLYVECTEHPRHKQHHTKSLLKGYDNISNGYVKEQA